MNRSKAYALEQAKIRGQKKSICVAELVQVAEFYPEDMTVDVIPMVMEKQKESYIERSPLLKIPVMLLGSLDIPVRPWYKSGDVGLVVYLDQDSDSVLESGNASKPQTLGYHTGEHGVFVGAILSGGKSLEMPDNPDEKAISAGMPEHYISVTEKEISIKTSKEVKIKGKVKIEGSLEVNGVSVPG